ncbi:NUDIX domain-containing protein [Defluviimonas sp. WL0050]|uniref:ADP-ribose pyrophosphatase n=1 Tax=Albidovulum litorale TaxID=2984134 RepID=A0ABT2ZP17_9RHOB|nr:NUDIX domain-containing protein [Defluviimonas sp. WL0050]MCV2872862.1 NUDIX domain-containing protein [Defluviimonas sp. WL0050]
MTTFFFYGTLCHGPLLRVVLGRDVQAIPGRLPDHSVFWVAGRAFPMIETGGSGAEGVLVADMSDEDVARLNYYEGGFAYQTRDVIVEAEGAGSVSAQVYFPDPGKWTPGAPWHLADWAARWGETVVTTAYDAMALYGLGDPAEIHARYPQMLMRGGSRVRAEAETPGLHLRRRAGREDVAVARKRQVYANYFAVEESDLRFRRFDGSMSPEVNRAVFISGDATVVLPYDPVRDRVLLVEQFRMGPHGRGDPQSWLIETVAGRIDGGESPEEAALREAREEAGLAIRELIPALNCYPSPAAMAEYLYTYIGIADLPDDAAGIGGVEGEAEDIRAHIVPFSTLMELVESGEANTAPLALLAYWLDRNRARIRSAAGA